MTSEDTSETTAKISSDSSMSNDQSPMSEESTKQNPEQTPGSGDDNAGLAAQSASAEAADSESEDAEVLVDTVSEEELPALVQALLMASGEPISIDRLCAATKHDEDAIALAIQMARDWLNREHVGFELVEVAGQYQLRTRAKFAPFIRQLKAGKPRRLSSAALETLAIIAYRQPIVKSDIEGLRGVDCTPTLKTLLDRRLVRIVGHQQTIGQPALYGTTEEFLKLFGLPSLGALPTLRELKELDREPGEPQQQETAPQTAAEPAPESATTH